MSPWIIWVYAAIQLLLVVYLVYILVRLLPLILYVRQPLPFIPINPRAARAIARLPEIQRARAIIDLGCGTGTLLAAISHTQRHTRLVGVDLNPALLRLARWRSRWWRNPPTCVEADLFHYPIGEFDVIVGWWVPNFAKRLLPKFLADCRPGTVIISYMFALPEHAAFQHTTQRCGREPIHIYRRT